MRPRFILSATATAAGIAAIGAPALASGSMAYIATSGRVTVSYPIMLANDDGSGARRVATGADATISPDGTKIAYQISTRAGDPVTRILEIASGAMARVPGTCQYGLFWSPDSGSLACLTQSTRGEYVTGNGLAVATVPASLAGVSSITPAVIVPARGNSVDYQVSFSPDSQSLAFANQRFTSGALRDLYVVQVANPASRTRVLTRATNPVWGPAGIAVTRQRNVRVRLGPGPATMMIRGQVWLLNPDGTGARQLTHYASRGLVFGPSATAWAPSGSALVGTVGGEDYSQAARIDVATGRVTMLSRNTVSSALAVSADGRTVLLQDGLADVQTRIRLVGIGGTGARTIVNRATGATVTANWNP